MAFLNDWLFILISKNVARIDEWFGRSNRRSGLPVSKNVWMKRRKLAALLGPQLALLSSRHMLKNSSFNLQLNLEKNYHPCRNPPWRRGTNRPRNTWHRGGSVEDLKIIFVNILNKIKSMEVTKSEASLQKYFCLFFKHFLAYQWCLLLAPIPGWWRCRRVHVVEQFA